MQEVETLAAEPSDNAQDTTVPLTPQAVEPPRVDDPSIPEGVDPAFLAALPEEIRQEVIRDHLRQQRAQRIAEAQPLPPLLKQPTQQGQVKLLKGTSHAAAAQPAPVETDPEDVLDQEFLAALPPELQEEVLAQHEQRIAQRNRPQAAAAAEPAAVDVASVFESLPPGLRAQVLADADDSVIQILPPHLLAEANRLRANLEQQQVFRFARMLGRPITVGRTMNNARTLQQQMPGGASAAGSNEERGVQIFDRESIVTLLMLYFLDHEKFSLMRLQKLLKPLCLHSGTCDYIIWCLVSMLDVLNNDTGEDDILESTNTALNQPEKTIRLLPDSVRVHQLVKSNVCLRILDTLVFLARNFPHHFLPNKIRMPSVSTKRWDPVPEIKHFWEVVKSVNKKTNAEEHKPSAKALSQIRDIIPGSLEQSALAFLLHYSGTSLVKSNAPLMDKSMRILQIVAQSIPSNCQAISEGSMKWLNTCLQELSKLILDNCLEEGLKDGRLFLNEILRTMPSQRPAVFTMLYTTVKDQGMKLQEEIKTLLDELAQLKIKKLALVGETTTKGRDGPPASNLKAFTSRNSQPKKFLKSLETISFLRNQLKLAEKRKRAAVAAVPPPAVAPTTPATTTASANSAPEANPAVAAQASEAPAVATDPTPDAASTAMDTAPAASTEVDPNPSLGATPDQPQTSGTAAQGPDVPKVEEEQPKGPTEAELSEERNLQDMLESLDPLWKLLSTCLEEMSALLDSHAVLSLQHAAEAFFLAHSFSINQKEGGGIPDGLDTNAQPSTSTTTAVPYTGGLGAGRLDVNKYTQNMFHFAEKHRTVLNQILRGNTNNLMEDSAFAILTHFPKLLDFDVKRKYFYKEIRKLDDRSRHEDVAIRIRRDHFFSDSYRELFRIKNSEWKARFYIIFEGEEGQDAGGLLREWYSIITREAFNPGYALFQTAPGDKVTYMISKQSYVNTDHLTTSSLLGEYQDIESEDPSYFKSLEFLLNNPIEDLGTELTFSVEVDEFGVQSMRDLKENGSNLLVTDANKEEYVQLVCQMKMTSSIRKQLDAFLEGFYQIIPKKLISIFNEQELELLVSELHSLFTPNPMVLASPALFEQEDLAKFLQFVTGTSKVPLQGFSHLEGMNGVQKFTIHMDSRSSDRLPSAHTCFNQLDLPQYESYEQLKKMVLLAIRECSEGFAFA
uniref:HECT-type E3 ubiquitin transferase n=1 Tax=Ditylenchus dipsaci TaxID=166011 RepID=A0A915ELL0_9BILA